MNPQDSTAPSYRHGILSGVMLCGIGLAIAVAAYVGYEVQSVRREFNDAREALKRFGIPIPGKPNRGQLPPGCLPPGCLPPDHQTGATIEPANRIERIEDRVNELMERTEPDGRIERLEHNLSYLREKFDALKDKSPLPASNPPWQESDAQIVDRLEVRRAACAPHLQLAFWLAFLGSIIPLW